MVGIPLNGESGLPQVCLWDREELATQGERDGVPESLARRELTGNGVGRNEEVVRHGKSPWKWGCNIPGIVPTPIFQFFQV